VLDAFVPPVLVKVTIENPAVGLALTVLVMLPAVLLSAETLPPASQF